MLPQTERLLQREMAVLLMARGLDPADAAYAAALEGIVRQLRVGTTS